MSELIETAIDEIYARDIYFRVTDNDSYHDRMAGYILALYDVGLISQEKRDEYETQFDLDLFPDIR